VLIIEIVLNALIIRPVFLGVTLIGAATAKIEFLVVVASFA
jgi:hypothetical protein